MTNVVAPPKANIDVASPNMIAPTVNPNMNALVSLLYSPLPVLVVYTYIWGPDCPPQPPP
jgi:hypothetical protein